MEHAVLVIDFQNNDKSSELLETLESLTASATLKFCRSVDEVEIEMTSESTVGMIIVSDKYDSNLDMVLRSFQNRVCCLPDFISFVCDDPSPRFLVSIFEFGVETIFSFERAKSELGGWLQGVNEALKDETMPETSAILLSRGIKTQNADLISRAGKTMTEMADYYHKAAFIAGKVSEIQGDFDKAEQAYRNAADMNKMYRPTSSSLAETLLINGKADEAVAIFEKLEKSNPRDLARKSNLIAAYVETGDMDKANNALSEAEALNPEHPKVKEAKAHILISKGKVGDAFNLMDDMVDAGPLFASKLNDMGIRLSKSGKTKSSLALYNKVHKIVRQDLKYKVSLNAALACRRGGAYDKALQYLKRCAKEYGSVFPKLKRIIEATKKAAEKKKEISSKEAS